MLSSPQPSNSTSIHTDHDRQCRRSDCSKGSGRLSLRGEFCIIDFLLATNSPLSPFPPHAPPPNHPIQPPSIQASTANLGEATAARGVVDWVWEVSFCIFLLFIFWLATNSPLSPFPPHALIQPSNSTSIHTGHKSTHLTYSGIKQAWGRIFWDWRWVAGADGWYTPRSKYKNY